VGDPTLSAKEIIGNESQKNVGWSQKTSTPCKKLLTESAPYVPSDVTGDHVLLSNQKQLVLNQWICF
jgi:hypothetical protein